MGKRDIDRQKYQEYGYDNDDKRDYGADHYVKHLANFLLVIELPLKIPAGWWLHASVVERTPRRM